MSTLFPVTHSILSAKALMMNVLSAYDTADFGACRLLSRGLNDTYEVTTSKGEQYVLRVYRTNWRSLDDIAFELDLLNHVSAKGVACSSPVPQRDGTFVQTVDAPEGKRHVVLFTYASGKEPSYEETLEAQALAYGKATAQFHNAAQDFRSPYSRPSLDSEYLIDAPMTTIGPLLQHRPEDWAYLQALVNKIRHRLSMLPPDELEMGVCHGDFHGGNAHISESGVVTFFDFDCCGLGWRAYDIAVFRWSARLRGKEKERWESFLQGYTEERHLADADLRAIPLFIGIRHIWLLGLHTGNGQDWGFGWMNDGYFSSQLKFLKEWEAEYCTD